MSLPLTKGCWTCKARRKKCDGRRPHCNECERLRLNCQGYQQRLLFEDDEIRAGMKRRGWRRKGALRNQNVATAQDTVDGAKGGEVAESFRPTILVTVERSLLPFESLLLHWYVDRFARSYPSFNHDRNPFLSAMLPIAYETPCLMKAMLAVAGTQACGQQPSLRPITLQCRIAALRGLRANLSSESMEAWSIKEVLGALACTMTLFIYEKIECEANALRSHLFYAARLVERLVGVHHLLDDDALFLIRLFIHNDIYTSFALRQCPALDSLPVTATPTVLPPNSFPDMMASIARLAATEDADLPRKLLHLFDSLTVWEPSMNWLPTASSQEQTATMALAAQIHQRAAIATLERSLGFSPDPSAIVSSLDILYAIPEADPITASLLWPAVVLGAEITDETQRDILRARLSTLAHKTGFKQYLKALQLLQDCWIISNSGVGCTVSWIDVMHTTGNVFLCTL